ncbi:MAG: photosystem II protein Psb27 [Cyanobacteria bacterium P01_A01_bin.84]
MKRYLSRLFALALVLLISVTGCNSANTGSITGDYRQDTLNIVSSLRDVLQVANDDPNKSSIETQARQQMKDFAARYQRDKKVSGLSSFTTVRTALNSLAGHYSSYPNRPVPEKLKNRLEQEFKRVEAALMRGS